MATFYLLIEKNLTGDLPRIDVFLDNNPGCCIVQVIIGGGSRTI